MKRHRSVLDGKKDISGLPSEKESPVEKAKRNEHSADDCDSVLDGPECIQGVPQKSRKSE